MTIYELIHFKKMVRVWKTKSPLFCLRYDPPIVFRRQNHITVIFIKTMSHDLLVQMASYPLLNQQYRISFSKDQWLKLNSFRTVDELNVCRGSESATISARCFPFFLQINRDWRLFRMLFETWTKLLSKLAVHCIQLNTGYQ